MENELTALHTGVIRLGELELPCYVLSNEKRVLSQSEVVKLITGTTSSGDLASYLNAKAIKPFLPKHFQDDFKSNILIFRSNNKIAHGYEASGVVDICSAYLKARQAGGLNASQARNAE